jgi:hypothetical protein
MNNDLKEEKRRKRKEKRKNKLESENNLQIVLYKHEKQSKHILKDVYDNFFNKKKYIIENDIDMELLNLSKKDNVKIKKEQIIFKEEKKDIILDKDNFLIYNFDVKKDFSYKIKCKLFSDEIKNIKLIISNSEKRFIYNFTENNSIEDKIYEYGFILDNNFNCDDNINVYLTFYNDNNINNEKCSIIEHDKINEIFFEVLQKIKVPNEDSLIIFNVNNKYYPLYTNEQNILNYIEFIDNSAIFFI